VDILLVSSDADGAWFVWLLAAAGHRVDWTVKHKREVDTLKGIIPAPLPFANPANYDLVVFDLSGMGAAADAARKVTPTIGGSSLADRLEDDRVFGIEAMEQAGIKVPAWQSFSSPAEALAFLNKNKKRYVLKPIGDAPSDATYVSKSAEDMARFIETRLDAKVQSFVLQEFVEGTEVSTEAWWTGTQWVALNHTLELKKLMVDDKGPNTGCAGNVVWMPAKPNAIFQQGLERIGSLLQQAGFVGMIDLNAIVTEGELYGLEWTPRFGYEGTCNLTRLLPMEFGAFLHAVAIGQAPTLGEPKAAFAATIRLSVPPYPSAKLSKKLVQVPIAGIDLQRLDSFFLCDVIKEGEEIKTSGLNNAIGTPIGVGATIESAVGEVESAISRLDIPNLQYRTDVAAVLGKRYRTLERGGWLRPIG
jgi:phosphoribosylamine-glycine ligase